MDEQAFIELCREHREAMFRMSQAMLGSAADAEDAVQQALLNAWRWRARIRQDTGRAYLMRIAVNCARDIQRRRMRMIPMERLPEDAYAPPDSTLREALAALPEKLRLPLLLHHMEGLSEQEKARALHITLSACKSRLYQARKALARELNEEVELP